MKDFFANLTLGKSIFLIVLLILITVAIIYLIVFVLTPRKKQKVANKKSFVKKEPEQPKPEPEVQKVEEVKEEVVKEEENQETESQYVSPLILDRAKYEIALQEKLEKERQERIDRQAMETARLEMLKNKEFQSHAGYISTLQRFSKKDQLENQLANGGKVDRELLNTYLNEKSTSISEEFQNMSPELKAVILSDLMKRKY